MYLQRQGYNGGCGWLAFLLVVVFASFVILSLLTFIMVVIGIAVYRFFLWWTVPQPRLFNAPPLSRWRDTYEHGLFVLEKNTGYDTNSSPTRLLGASLILTLPPLMLLTMLFPTTGWILPIVGLILAFMSSMMLSQPYDWFTVPRLNSADSPLDLDEHPEDAILLAEDDW